MPTLIFADDTTFRQRVLASPLPVLACFTAEGCTASQALRLLLQGLAPRYIGQLTFVETDAGASVAEQFGVAATPSLLVFRHGDEVLRSVGFLPAPLLELLCADAAQASGEYSRQWAPLEERFEQAALLPLLDGLGLRYQRQHQIINWPKSARSGRIDLLVHDEGGLVTLIESKRGLRSETDLRAAVRQAHSYARAMQTASFVVAAPAGLWVYASHGERALLEQAFSWLDLEQGVAPFGELLMWLRARSLHAVQGT
ncbi:MAG: hypothetical protein H7Z42_02805 [Roseiflexaceae bacterium]|nr:hypothetical protein [Roseiflexaceae bacterium]